MRGRSNVVFGPIRMAEPVSVTDVQLAWLMGSLFCFDEARAIFDASHELGDSNG